MAELNLNFHKNTCRHEPTKYEITQIESVAISVEAIIKALAEYAGGRRGLQTEIISGPSVRLLYRSRMGRNMILGVIKVSCEEEESV